MTKKVQAILNVDPPKTRKQLRRFIGMVNYYRDLWQHRSEDLAPLTQMTSNNKTFRWDQEHQQAFDKI